MCGVSSFAWQSNKTVTTSPLPTPTPCQNISATKTKTEELVQIEEGKRNVTSDGDTKSRVFFLLRNKILIKSFLLGRLTKSEKALQIE